MTNLEIVLTETAIRVQTGELQDGDIIHTYEGWKARGFQVKRGEHSTIKFPIWKRVWKKDKKTGAEMPKMFLQTASWFTQNQVEEIAK